MSEAADVTAVPPRAYTALGVAIQAYEPEAAALLARSPAALLQVLLEAGRRAAVAAAPAIGEAAEDFFAATAREELAKPLMELGAQITRQGAEAERARLSAVISPAQFRKLAEWFDVDDEFKEAMFPQTWSPGSRKDDVQQDLRKFADLLDGDDS